MITTQGIADYQFIRPLGEGNHGEFWLAMAPPRLGIDGEVAVKTLHHQATEDDFRRMANELRLYAAIASDHLVDILDAGHHHGTLFYVTPFHPDGSLAAPARPLGPAEVLRCLADAARAADAMHQVGVAHRDIKPANVMIDGAGGRLGDLGLAQVLSPGQTVTGTGPLGAIEYLAPEIIRGDGASRASDIWSLGATVHRSLTGRGLYSGIPENDLLAALRHILEHAPRLDDGLDPPTRSVIERCTAADPRDRFPTAATVAERLDELAETAS